MSQLTVQDSFADLGPCEPHTGKLMPFLNILLTDWALCKPCISTALLIDGNAEGLDTGDKE